MKGWYNCHPKINNNYFYEKGTTNTYNLHTLQFVFSVVL